MDPESTTMEKLEHMDDKIDIDKSNLTPIQEFYKDANIFITGATSFLDQILIEKLLRSCPVSTLYLLVNHKSSDSTPDEMFDNLLFDRMKKSCPDYKEKVVVVEGDCGLPDLGLCDQDKKLLMDEVTVVFHTGATVSFEDSLATAAAVNLRSTRDLSRLAQQMTRLKSFIHVSTAYCNCTNDVIEEKIYPPSMSCSHLLEITNTCDLFLLDNLTPSLIGKYPNTNVYTKQIAEDVVKEETQGIAAGIYRPAIGMATYKEPIRGWINNIYGAAGISFGADSELLRVLHCDKDILANMVPVDMCVNGLIASAWNVAKRFQEANKNFQIPVYNFESSNDQSLKSADFEKLASRFVSELSSVRTLWIHMFYVKFHPAYAILKYLLHYLTGVIGDFTFFRKGKKMSLLAAHQKIDTFDKLLAPFTTKTFVFKSTNLRTMLYYMSKKDREVFFCDLKELDWNEFFYTYAQGCRVYLAKDPLETIPAGQKRYKRLLKLHNTVLVILGLLAVLLIWNLLSAIYRIVFV